MKSNSGRNDRTFLGGKSRPINTSRSRAIHRHKDERNLMENLCQLQLQESTWEPSQSCSSILTSPVLLPRAAPQGSAVPGFALTFADGGSHWGAKAPSEIPSPKMAGRTSQKIGGTGNRFLRGEMKIFSLYFTCQLKGWESKWQVAHKPGNAPLKLTKDSKTLDKVKISPKQEKVVISKEDACGWVEWNWFPLADLFFEWQTDKKFQLWMSGRGQQLQLQTLLY